MKRYIISAILLAFASTTVSAQAIEDLTLRQKAAKMLIVGFRGVTVDDNPTVRENVVNRGVSGVIFFEHNITPVEQGKNSLAILQKTTADIQALTPEKLFIAVDQEGGRVNRLKSKYGFKEMVSHKDVGAKDDPTYTKEMGATIASEVKRAGFNVNFAPDVDVDINPTCPIVGKFGRSFSSDENKVIEHAGIYIEEHHNQGILTSLKHFPGHGSSKADSHLGLTDITDTWQERELTPFRELILEGKCDMLMVSHLFNAKFDPKYPATLSLSTIDSLARKELNWDGVIISDDMHMKAITDNYGFEESIALAAAAGVDLFILSSYSVGGENDMALRAINAIVEAVESGKITIEQIDRSVERIEELRKLL